MRIWPGSTTISPFNIYGTSRDAEADKNNPLKVLSAATGHAAATEASAGTGASAVNGTASSSASKTLDQPVAGD